MKYELIRYVVAGIWDSFSGNVGKIQYTVFGNCNELCD